MCCGVAIPFLLLRALSKVKIAFMGVFTSTPGIALCVVTLERRSNYNFLYTATCLPFFVTNSGFVSAVLL